MLLGQMLFIYLYFFIEFRFMTSIFNDCSIYYQIKTLINFYVNNN